MCYDELRFDDFETAHGVDPREYFARELDRLDPLVTDGLVSVDHDGICISDAGRLLLRSVAMVFDRYVGQEELRYSKAI